MSPFRRLHFAPLLGAILLLHGLPAHAQIDRAAEIRIVELEAKVTRLQLQIDFLKRQTIRIESDLNKRLAAQQSGRGMVTTGPFDGGLAGTLGSGLTPASTIVCKMKGK